MDNINWVFFGVFISEQSKKRNMDALHRAGITIPEGFLTCLTSIGDTTDFNYAYEVLCFADGTPFGIKEE